MKRRKFLKSTAMAIAATAIPAAVLATIHERSRYITGCDHVISLRDYRCLKCGITEEALVNQVSEFRNFPNQKHDDFYGEDVKNRLATERLKRLMQEPRPWYTVRELEDKLKQVL
jgi:hypothetical protein